MASHLDTDTQGKMASTQFANRQQPNGYNRLASDTAPMRYTPKGNNTVTVSSTAVKSGSGLTLPSGTTHCIISVEQGGSLGGIRYWDSGNDPTSTQGFYLAPGSGPLMIDRPDLLSMIRQGSVDATIQIEWVAYEDPNI
jgi:hypothetical protein